MCVICVCFLWSLMMIIDLCCFLFVCSFFFDCLLVFDCTFFFRVFYLAFFECGCFV